MYSLKDKIWVQTKKNIPEYLDRYSASKEGYLRKRHPFEILWKKRYFCIIEDYLCYFRAEEVCISSFFYLTYLNLFIVSIRIRFLLVVFLLMDANLLMQEIKILQFKF